MANSSANERPRSFLIKVNREAVPGRTSVPQEASQLEEGAFLTRHPRKTIKRDGLRVKLTPEQTGDPRAGDRLYIWINGEYDGRGLTASARAARDASPTDAGLSISVCDVELLLAAGIDRNQAERLATPENVFDDILRSTVATLRWIPDEHAQEIDRAVRRHSTGDPHPPLPVATAVAPPPETGSDAPRGAETGGSRGQGFRRWAQHRLLIEERAMEVAREFLERERWVICDRSCTESYDLLCSRGNQRLRRSEGHNDVR
jgi:hypothetical protein